ncbi:hypothetical protein PIROE2DRAFT_20928 [Piromyces sp. E2]|nr:hypothetical protein PIROE2DRAFT_20928 [Piromyces sp. E2]|eukprot:OUM61584.1 hypothetical protein PIROE2DRAFT_20928 [Piromyces sp. E2]
MEESEEINLNPLVYEDNIDANEECYLINEGKSSNSDMNQYRDNEIVEIDTINNTSFENIQKKPQRIYYIDFLRIFANFLVIYIHASAVNIERVDFRSHQWYGLFIQSHISYHCVPLFVAISGVFFLNPEKELPYKKLYQKYIFHIVKSLLFWAPFYAIVDRFIINFNHIPYSFNKVVLHETIKSCFLAYGHLWYLYFVIGLYMITPFLRPIVKDRRAAWYAVWFFFIFRHIIPSVDRMFKAFSYKYGISYLTEFKSELKIELLGDLTTYYLLGYLLSSGHIKNKFYIYLLSLMGIISPFLNAGVGYLECYHRGMEQSDFNTYYENLFVSLSTIGTFIFFKYIVSGWVEPLMRVEIIKKFVLKLSECSFGSYLVHMAVYNLYHRFKIHSTIHPTYYWIFVYSVLIYMTSFIIIYILRKISIFKHVT